MLSPIQTLEPTVTAELLPAGRHGSSPSAHNNNFQKYLEEEQQRLALLFSPINQYDFSAWFSYVDFSSSASGNNGSDLRLFSDTNSATRTTENNHPLPPANQPATAPAPRGETANIFNLFSSQPKQQMLQSLLTQSGWLNPNLAALPQFQFAQLGGKLLPRFDLQALVDEIVSRVQLVKDKGKIELTLGLIPADLGEILMTLTSQAGSVTIQIQASAETKKLLDQQLSDLTAALKKNNIIFSEIVITATGEVIKHA